MCFHVCLFFYKLIIIPMIQQVQRVVSLPVGCPVWWTQTVSVLIFFFFFQIRNLLLIWLFIALFCFCCAASSRHETSSPFSCAWTETSARLWSTCCRQWTPRLAASPPTSSSFTSASSQRPRRRRSSSLSRHSYAMLMSSGVQSKVRQRGQSFPVLFQRFLY